MNVSSDSMGETRLLPRGVRPWPGMVAILVSVTRNEAVLSSKRSRAQHQRNA
jgi:hypothetical protein